MTRLGEVILEAEEVLLEVESAEAVGGFRAPSGDSVVAALGVETDAGSTVRGSLSGSPADWKANSLTRFGVDTVGRL